MTPEEALVALDQMRQQVQAPGAVHDQLRQAVDVLAQALDVRAVQSGANGEAAPAQSEREVGHGVR